MQTLVRLLLGEAPRGALVPLPSHLQLPPAWRSAFLPGEVALAPLMLLRRLQWRIPAEPSCSECRFWTCKCAVYTQLLSLLFHFESYNPFIPTLLPFPLFFLCFWLLLLSISLRTMDYFWSIIWVLKSILKLILKLTHFYFLLLFLRDVYANWAPKC